MAKFAGSGGKWTGKWTDEWQNAPFSAKRGVGTELAITKRHGQDDDKTALGAADGFPPGRPVSLWDAARRG